MEYDADQIKKDAETSKELLLARKNMRPPMSQRMTVSVPRLLEYCNGILFLCSLVTKLRDENRQLKLDMERIKKLAKNGQNP